MNGTDSWLDEIRWTEGGLVPVIVQEAESLQVLMFAWMNREALTLTLSEGFAVYWSRSRNKLWRKGEESGHRQRVVELRLDCDQDALLMRVEQLGGIACHTGRQHCFFRKLVRGAWREADPVIKDPGLIYGPKA